MAPAPSTPSSSTPFKAPPTGPKALRGIPNGSNSNLPPTPSSSISTSFNRHDKVSFGLPQSRSSGSLSNPSSGGRFTTGFDNRSNGFNGSKAPPTGPRGTNSNGYKPSSSSSTAESSRYASSSRSRDDRRPLSPGYSRPPSPPAPPPPPEEDDHRGGSSSSSSSFRQTSKSPVKGTSSSPRKRRSTGGQSDTPEMLEFRSKLNIENNRAPISFAIPTSGFVPINGKARAVPPQLDSQKDDSRSTSFESTVKSKSKWDEPPPPPRGRPPTPPPPASPEDEPPPPPDNDSRPPSPPYRRTARPPPDTPPRDPSPPPRPQTPPLPRTPTPPPPTFKPFSIPSSSLPPKPMINKARPSTPPTEPPPLSQSRNLPIRPPSPTSLPPSAGTVQRRSTESSSYVSQSARESSSRTEPPAIHFRDLSRRPSTPSDEEEVEEVEEKGPWTKVNSSAYPPPPPESAGPSRQPSPPPSPPPLPKPDWVRPEYVPPPFVHRRPGIRNYLVVSDLSRGTKNVFKRYDGEAEGDVVVPVDPRKSSEDVSKGRGTAKNRQAFYEVEYEWNEHSVGPKPPPPPPAVLITDLNALTTVDQITKFLRPHGRIREIDPKMDSKSGMQLGICWVKFEGPPSGKKGTAHDVAVQVVKVCNGQRIGLSGQEKIKVVLDGRGLRAAKAVKEEMARRYPPKKVVPPAPAAPVPQVKAAAPTPSSGSGTPTIRTPAQTPIVKPIPTGPSNPTVPQPKPFHSSLPSRPTGFSNATSFTPPYASTGRSGPTRSAQPILPNRPANLPVRPVLPKTIDSSFIESPFERPAKHYDDRRGGYRSKYDSRSRSRSRSRTRELSHPLSCTTCGDSDSEDDRPRYNRSRRSPSPVRGRGRGRVSGKVDRKEEEEAIERVKKVLEKNGHGYVFIDRTSLPVDSAGLQLKEHFRAFRPVDMVNNHLGWFILFGDDSSAAKAKVLDGSSYNGHRLVLQVKYPSTKKNENAPAAGNDVKATKEKSWKFLTITKKNRPAPAKVVKVTTLSPEVQKKSRKMTYSSSSEDDETVKPARKRSKSVSSKASDDDLPLIARRPAKPATKEPLVDPTVIVASTEEPISSVKDVDNEIGKNAKKRPGKTKMAKTAKKARLDEDAIVDIPLPAESEIAEIKLDETLVAPDATEKIKPVKPVKAPKPKKAAKTELEKFLETGVIENEEDAYWLGQALAATHEGIEPDLSDVESDEEDDQVGEDHPLFHVSGSWRAEGWKKVPVTAKAEYLPERNRAVVSSEKESGGHASGRTARVTGRRLAHDMETTRKTATTNTAESEMLAFNQLSMRKKALRFSRSPIEGYGLYAMESINPGEMVCEYVGEICRSAVAEIREQRYLKQGIGSSYLFRIDNDMVCDATFKGSVSRLINHSCDPSASAKIISINGQSKIVIYAKRMLHPGQEILYDYKFPLESDPALRVPCLCGAATCRGWLN